MVKFTLKGISNLTESPAYFQQVNGIYRKDGALALYSNHDHEFLRNVSFIKKRAFERISHDLLIDAYENQGRSLTNFKKSLINKKLDDKLINLIVDNYIEKLIFISFENGVNNCAIIATHAPLNDAILSKMLATNKQCSSLCELVDSVNGKFFRLLKTLMGYQLGSLGCFYEWVWNREHGLGNFLEERLEAQLQGRGIHHIHGHTDCGNKLYENSTNLDNKIGKCGLVSIDIDFQHEIREELIGCAEQHATFIDRLIASQLFTEEQLDVLKQDDDLQEAVTILGKVFPIAFITEHFEALVGNQELQTAIEVMVKGGCLLEKYFKYMLGKPELQMAVALFGRCNKGVVEEEDLKKLCDSPTLQRVVIALTKENKAFDIKQYFKKLYFSTCLQKAIEKLAVKNNGVIMQKHFYRLLIDPDLQQAVCLLGESESGVTRERFEQLESNAILKTAIKLLGEAVPIGQNITDREYAALQQNPALQHAINAVPMRVIKKHYAKFFSEQNLPEAINTLANGNNRNFMEWSIYKLLANPDLQIAVNELGKGSNSTVSREQFFRLYIIPRLRESIINLAKEKKGSPVTLADFRRLYLEDAKELATKICKDSGISLSKEGFNDLSNNESLQISVIILHYWDKELTEESFDAISKNPNLQKAVIALGEGSLKFDKKSFEQLSSDAELLLAINVLAKGNGRLFIKDYFFRLSCVHQYRECVIALGNGCGGVVTKEQYEAVDYYYWLMCSVYALAKGNNGSVTKEQFNKLFNYPSLQSFVSSFSNKNNNIVTAEQFDKLVFIFKVVKRGIKESDYHSRIALDKVSLEVIVDLIKRGNEKVKEKLIVSILLKTKEYPSIATLLLALCKSNTFADEKNKSNEAEILLSVINDINMELYEAVMAILQGSSNVISKQQFDQLRSNHLIRVAVCSLDMGCVGHVTQEDFKALEENQYLQVVLDGLSHRQSGRVSRDQFNKLLNDNTLLESSCFLVMGRSTLKISEEEGISKLEFGRLANSMELQAKITSRRGIPVTKVEFNKLTSETESRSFLSHARGFFFNRRPRAKVDRLVNGSFPEP